jgi:predicted nuclease of predicted toxin-antitoxin system
VKFLADMGISPTTVAFLQALGHDAAPLADQGLERLPDSGIVEKARQEERILLVHDLGFGELAVARERPVRIAQVSLDQMAMRYEPRLVRLYQGLPAVLTSVATPYYALPQGAAWLCDLANILELCPRHPRRAAQVAGQWRSYRLEHLCLCRHCDSLLNQRGNPRETITHRLLCPLWFHNG